MKNNTLHKQKDSSCLAKNGTVYSFCFLAGLFVIEKGHAQFYNKGDVAVQDKTILSVYEDYENDNSGDFTNDGEVYIYKNWLNNGIVNFTPARVGKTFFHGTADQLIEGTKQSNFQNVEFNNSSDAIPFYLGTTIAVNTKAEFIKGIIDGIALPDALVVFNENAIHEKTGDQSFVDGKVQKTGKAAFEFPVGNELFFRPSYHAKNNLENNTYTTQYFYKNSNSQHSHSQREKEIQLINNKEYWTVTKTKESENVILSLTLDSKTTPSEFFNVSAGKKIAIVRWDGTKWISEGGALRERDSSDPESAATYSHIITAEVKGFGMFTIALVDDVIDDELIIYNAVSPNGDGLNDTFHIKGIDKYPDNTVEIYNRWGVKVYDAKGYNETDVMFGGYSDGRATINRGEKLPTGTYFYLLKYNDGKKVREKAGYLYINNE